MNGQKETRVHLPQIELGYIRQLQQDNGDLRTLLEEHQATLQMIMSKYRQQVCVCVCVCACVRVCVRACVIDSCEHVLLFGLYRLEVS